MPLAGDNTPSPRFFGLGWFMVGGVLHTGFPHRDCSEPAGTTCSAGKKHCRSYAYWTHNVLLLRHHLTDAFFAFFLRHKVTPD